MAGGGEVTLEVNANHLVPVVFGEIHQYAVAQDTRVVHQHVQIAEGFERAVHEIGRAVPGGHVVVIGDRLGAHGRELRDDLFGRARFEGRAVQSPAEVVDDHLGPFGGEEQSVLAADAATSSR